MAPKVLSSVSSVPSILFTQNVICVSISTPLLFFLTTFSDDIRLYDTGVSPGAPARFFDTVNTFCSTTPERVLCVAVAVIVATSEVMAEGCIIRPASLALMPTACSVTVKSLHTSSPP